ncbi:DUF4041 domain-containing protein [uncultured Cohaesibacter sp.]|uniref:DUF4041 domain-containing protein n=1 Tax=uncultured Cohaesibacter sp. TaxID=1002546 RepID=UPI002930213A|nr:DUF4041 domain-containing protein [uncultured Cohaesibacter sp.]
MSEDAVILVLLFLFFIVVPAILIAAIVKLRRRNKKIAKLKQMLDPLLSINEQVEQAQKEVVKKEQERREVIAEVNRVKDELQKIKEDLNGLENEYELYLNGYSAPEFSLEDSAAYVMAIKLNKEEQKELIRQKIAVVCSTDWEVHGSRKDGKTMVNRAIRLTLRAFNNEADLLISKVTWRNASKTKEKIQRVAEILNDLNSGLTICIQPQFIALKLKQVDLVNEQALKKEEDKERLREQRELEREEAKAQREIAAEMKRQEKIEREKQQALAEARKRLEIASGEHRAALEEEISAIEAELAETMHQKGRLLSMAEQTRIGHVYVISNKGAFGAGVVKIGMTRRLEPLDRVKELGDASVPFPFDVHAMIFSDDAPKLEKELHHEFAQYRVNRVNNRKEFFRIGLDPIKEAIEERVPGTPFKIDAPSMEYMQSQ